MKTGKSTLLIPVENQVRELDAKLLLAYLAARRGLPSIIGPKRVVESRIASFPRSIYLAKSLFHGNRKFLGLARKLGHENVAWDEEALVHLPPEIYFSRRLSPVAMEYVSHLFAWGEDNAELWRQYPELPTGTPIHVTGNPRGDLLRPEMRGFYHKQAEEIRNNCGDFIIINTNFNHVNSFSPERNLFQPVEKPGEEPKFGRAARGMTREYAEGLRDHKQAVFEDFQELIPALEKTFPEHTIIVRPHPTESQETYHKLAAQCERVQVTNEGNVVPWLMATRALIHNGCTTGVEAYILRVPAISYRATVNDYYDYGFYKLPNRLSHQCFDFEELQQTLKKILSGELGVADGVEREELINQYLVALDGPLACERIVDVLQKTVDGLSKLPKPSLWNRLEGWYKATKRRGRQRSKSRDTSSHKLLEFQRHKYPQISLEELRARIERFQHLLDDHGELKVDQIFDKLFLIRP
jgi:surface carbohydrate biosynthesis protein